jgi:hypothetical protein
LNFDAIMYIPTYLIFVILSLGFGLGFVLSVISGYGGQIIVITLLGPKLYKSVHVLLTLLYFKIIQMYIHIMYGK